MPHDIKKNVVTKEVNNSNVDFSECSTNSCTSPSQGSSVYGIHSIPHSVSNLPDIATIGSVVIAGCGTCTIC
jgi:hypothetical protein